MGKQTGAGKPAKARNGKIRKNLVKSQGRSVWVAVRKRSMSGAFSVKMHERLRVIGVFSDEARANAAADTYVVPKSQLCEPGKFWDEAKIEVQKFVLQKSVTRGGHVYIVLSESNDSGVPEADPEVHAALSKKGSIKDLMLKAFKMPLVVRPLFSCAMPSI